MAGDDYRFPCPVPYPNVVRGTYSAPLNAASPQCDATPVSLLGVIEQRIEELRTLFNDSRARLETMADSVLGSEPKQAADGRDAGIARPESQSARIMERLSALEEVAGALAHEVSRVSRICG